MDQETRTMLIDARGKACPGPVMMADDALSKLQEGIIEVLVDNEESSLNLRGYAAQNGLTAEQSREGRDWKVKIVKGYACAPNAELRAQPSESRAKRLLLVVGTDVLGKDEDLGRTLMKGFFETMKVYRQLPHTLFFLNAGVNLTTRNSETVPLLKDIEALGVEIYSCGTCLKHYGSETELRVGHRGSTNLIVEALQDFDKVVWV
jgi:selenium metabolism protein YedF